MRIGMNPFKSVENVIKPKDITITVLVHIPYLSGYYLNSLDILQLTLGSIIKNTEIPFDLMVFDNGSCIEVKSFLKDLLSRELINYLILSAKNIGKNGAWNQILGAAPGKYIVYTDSDIFFHPGWLSEHLRLYEAFPRVGTITGFAMRRKPSFCDRTVELAEANPEIKVNKGKLIPQKQINEFITSLGKDPVKYAAKVKDVQDTIVQIHNVSAYVSAGHFQFMISAELAKQVLPLPSNYPVGRDEQFLDKAIEDSEHLRLATTKVLVEHIGNVLTTKWKKLLSEYAFSSRSFMYSQSGGKKRLPMRLANWRPIRTLTIRICNHIMNLCQRIMIFYSK